MYKFSIFLIVFILTLFELSLFTFFDKPLNSNILILTCIMILPGLFTFLERDAIEYTTMNRGWISQKIQRRKILFYFLEKIRKYAIIVAGIGSIYIGLFALIGNIAAITTTIGIILISLFLSAMSSIMESLLINS